MLLPTISSYPSSFTIGWTVTPSIESEAPKASTPSAMAR
jgi:hypothetical protein